MQKSINILVMFGMCLTCTHLSPAQAGKSGLSFLKLGISGRGVSMADAMSANVSGSAATYYNPAGILEQTEAGQSSELMIMHKEWIQDTRTEFLGVTVSLDETNAIGISMNSTTVSDIEIRTRPGTPEGKFTARNYSLGASYARRLSTNLRLGVTAKFLYEKILIDEASGFAIDFGAQLKTPVEGLAIGAAIANIGTMSAFHNDKTSLPTLFRVGPAYSAELEGISSSVTATSDFLYIVPEKKSLLSLGGEFLYDRTVAVRAGYQFGSEGRGLAAGIGVRYSIIGLDYAYAPLSIDLGNTHTFSLSLNL